MLLVLLHLQVLPMRLALQDAIGGPLFLQEGSKKAFSCRFGQFNYPH